MKKKTMAAMLLAMMQSAFAVQLMDGKYVNFEDFVREQGYHVVDQNGQVNVGSCRTVDNYKTNCVSGTKSTRRYFTNAMMDAAFTTARNMKGIGVYLPPGVWNFNEQIIVPHGMKLKGSYDRPHNVTHSDLAVNVQSSQVTVLWNKTDGTNIACYSGERDEPADYDPAVRDENACIALRGSATLDGVNVFYPEQPAPTETRFSPYSYPWTISCQTGEGISVHSGGDDASDFLSRCSIMNTTLVNSYAGIDLTASQDHYIKGVNMTAFKKGIRLDVVVSQGAIEDVNIHTQFCTSYYKISGVYAGEPSATNKYNNLESYITRNLVGMEFGWVDWAWISNVFIFKANKGFYFRRGFNGNNFFRAVPSVDIQNSGCDLCVDAVYAEEINSGIGVNFSNSNLLGRIYSGPDNYGPIRITNSHLAFDASIYSATKVGSTNLYDANHVDVGANTTMQITNSEVLDFVGDLNGLWHSASTFDVKGKLLVDNTTMAWPTLYGINLVARPIGGNTFRLPIYRFRVYQNAVLLTNNLLIRGDDQLRVAVLPSAVSTATIDTAHTAYDPLTSGYHPTAK